MWTVFLTLLRPLQWLKDYSVSEGAIIPLDLPEMAVEGDAFVLKVAPCPTTVEGEGSLVTGTFAHRSGTVLSLKVASEQKPLGVTASHWFWSIDRQQWVPAGMLQKGEKLLAKERVTKVESISASDEPLPVHNLEVEGDHVYRVGQSGVLVHNTSGPVSIGVAQENVRIDDCQFLPLTFLTSAGVKNGIYYGDTEPLPGGGERATGIKARLNKSTLRKGEDATFNPPGWDKTINVGLKVAKIARGHLLANVLGGAGKAGNPKSKRNIVPMCHGGTNLKMDHEVEVPIKTLLEGNGVNVLDYEVTVTYNDPNHPAVPDSIVVKGHVYNCVTSTCTRFVKTFPNETDLHKCQ